MEFEATGATTIYLHIPNEETFKQLVELKDLPECTLEISEKREICDTYLDTPKYGLLDQEMDFRLSRVDAHHFVIFNEVKARGKFLKAASEHVERLAPNDYQQALVGERENPLFTVAADHVTDALVPKLERRSILLSRIFKVGESRFEMGLETIVYDREGKQATDQLVSLDAIQGNEEVIEAIASYLKEKFDLSFVSEVPLARGMRLTA